MPLWITRIDYNLTDERCKYGYYNHYSHYRCLNISKHGGYDSLFDSYVVASVVPLSETERDPVAQPAVA